MVQIFLQVDKRSLLPCRMVICTVITTCTFPFLHIWRADIFLACSMSFFEGYQIVTEESTNEMRCVCYMVDLMLG